MGGKGSGGHGLSTGRPKKSTKYPGEARQRITLSLYERHIEFLKAQEGPMSARIQALIEREIAMLEEIKKAVADGLKYDSVIGHHVEIVFDGKKRVFEIGKVEDRNSPDFGRRYALEPCAPESIDDRIEFWLDGDQND